MGLVKDFVRIFLAIVLPSGLFGASLLILGVVGYRHTKDNLKRMNSRPVLKSSKDAKEGEMCFINGVINPITRDDGKREEVTGLCEAEKRSKKKFDSMSGVADKIGDYVPDMKGVSSLLTAAGQFGVILPGDTDDSPKGAARRYFEILTRMEIGRKTYPKPVGWWKRTYHFHKECKRSVNFLLTDSEGHSIVVTNFDEAKYFEKLLIKHVVFEETEPCPEVQQKLHAGYSYGGYDLEIESTECILPFGTPIGVYGRCIDTEEGGRKFMSNSVGTSSVDILERYSNECEASLKSDRDFIVMGSTLLTVIPTFATVLIIIINKFSKH